MNRSTAAVLELERYYCAHNVVRSLALQYHNADGRHADRDFQQLEPFPASPYASRIWAPRECPRSHAMQINASPFMHVELTNATRPNDSVILEPDRLRQL